MTHKYMQRKTPNLDFKLDTPRELDSELTRLVPKKKEGLSWK